VRVSRFPGVFSRVKHQFAIGTREKTIGNKTRTSHNVAPAEGQGNMTYNFEGKGRNVHGEICFGEQGNK
jgi:hypothetical protein